MDRRRLLNGVSTVLPTAPLAAGAQQAGKVYRIGILGDVPLTDAGEGAALWRAHPGDAEPGRPNVHVNGPRPPLTITPPGTDQISREVAPYIIALGPGGVLQGSGKMGVQRLRRINAP